MCANKRRIAADESYLKYCLAVNNIFTFSFNTAQILDLNLETTLVLIIFAWSLVQTWVQANFPQFPL